MAASKKVLLDDVFSMYIRLRDSQEFDFRYAKCISCSRIMPWRMLDCGHFYDRGILSLRTNEFNCNAECEICNRYSDKHLVSYKKNLIEKIGIEEFNKLGELKHEIVSISDWEYDEKIAYYKRKIKEFRH